MSKEIWEALVLVGFPQKPLNCELDSTIPKLNPLRLKPKIYPQRFLYTSIKTVHSMSFYFREYNGLLKRFINLTYFTKEKYDFIYVKYLLITKTFHQKGQKDKLTVN